MDSSSLAAIIEALTKLFNPKIEKELAKTRLDLDIDALKTLLGFGLKPEYMEYRDGRLHFKMIPPEMSNTQSVDIISFGDLKTPSLGSILQDEDDSKLKLETPQKKYE